MEEIIKVLDAVCCYYDCCYETVWDDYIYMKGSWFEDYYYDIEDALISWLGTIEDDVRHKKLDNKEHPLEEYIEFIEKIRKERVGASKEDIAKMIENIENIAINIEEQSRVIKGTLSIIKKETSNLKTVENEMENQLNKNTEYNKKIEIKVGDYISVNLEEEDSPVLSRVISCGESKYMLVSEDGGTAIESLFKSLKEIKDFSEKTDSIIYCVKDRLDWGINNKYLIYDNSGDSDFEVTIKYLKNDNEYKLVLVGSDMYLYEDETFNSIESLYHRILKDFSLVKQLRDID